MKTPTFLKKGDKVAIICTARKFFPEDCIPAIELLKSWGLEVVLGNTIGLDNYQLGGSDQERANDLQEMILRKDIQAIWIARGGYGTVRIIDLVDFSPLQENPKWIIGFSDVTVLHSHLNTLGISSIHSIMPYSVPTTDEVSKASLYNALFGKPLVYEIPTHSNNRFGIAKGELVGGNLSILYSLLGSISAIDTTNKILYFEDLDEYLYHIDRMVYNLKRNGYFEKIKGLIIGGMTDMHDNSIPFGCDYIGIIKNITKEYNFPVVFDFPAGHIKDNRALILGQEVTLEVGVERTRLTF